MPSRTRCPGRMTDEHGRGERAAASNPELSYEEEEEEDESSAESELSDTCSVLSDDSVYPCAELPAETGGAEDLSLYQCCLRNDAKLVRERLERGVSRREATELDINGRVSGWGRIGEGVLGTGKLWRLVAAEGG